MFNRTEARRLIEKSGLRRSFVADKIKRKHGTLTMYLTGQNEPPPSVVEDLAKVLKVDPRKLMN